MTTKAHAALEAEQQAAEQEGIFAPSKDQVQMLRRYRDLSKRRDEIDAEMKAISSAVFSEMEEAGARALQVAGKNWALISTVNRKVTDIPALTATFPAIVESYSEALAQFTSTKQTLRRALDPK